VLNDVLYVVVVDLLVELLVLRDVPYVVVVDLLVLNDVV